MFIKKIKEPLSALTHFIGAILVVPTTIALIYLAAKHATMRHVVAFSIFGASLFLLYTASTVYHSLSISEKVSRILKRIDHMMIFVLIAGTYTPVCLINLRGAWGYTLLALIWSFAIVGIILKIVWLDAPRRLSTAIYVIMGWMVVIAFYPLSKAVTLGGLILLTAGGVIYTLGAVVYALKWPKINLKYFGFHEIFHLFVMGGSFCHVLFMFILVC